MLFVAMPQLQPKTQPGVIILLNGTSSAGKSCIIQELEQIYDQKFQVASVDTFILKLAADAGVDLALHKDEFFAHMDWNNLYANFYTYTKKLSGAGQNLIIDTVLYEAHYETYDKILGTNVIKILVYCPLDKILDHITQRNQSDDVKEHRNIRQAFEQFLSLYTMQSSPDDTIIDLTNTKQMLHTLHEVQHQSTEKDYQKLMQKFSQQFNLDDSHKIILAQKYPWDLIVNTGIDSSQIAAQKISHFLESSTFKCLSKNATRCVAA
jgi:chloramphenicol 3-O-phosphotransferase